MPGVTSKQVREAIASIIRPVQPACLVLPRWFQGTNEGEWIAGLRKDNRVAAWMLTRVRAESSSPGSLSRDDLWTYQVNHYWGYIDSRASEDEFEANLAAVEAALFESEFLGLDPMFVLGHSEIEFETGIVAYGEPLVHVAQGTLTVQVAFFQ